MKRIILISLILAVLFGGAQIADAAVANVESHWVNGALVFYQAPYRMRVLKVVGVDTTSYIQGFASLPTDDVTTYPTEWTTTLVDGGVDGLDSAGLGTTAGGVWKILTNDSENDGQNIQLTGESYLPASGKPLYFEITLQIDDATESDFIAGLCITDTTLLGGMTYGIYYRKVDGSLSVAAVSESNSVEEESLAVGTMADATNITLGFWMESNTSIKFYVDGVLVATHSTTIPTAEELTPSVHFLTGEAAAHAMLVDRLHAVQIN
jgi:hypothetical protein